MAPSKKEIEAALVEGTYQVFSADPDATSVNQVRQHVEGKLGLEAGFLTNPDWKQISKDLIKKYVEKLLDGWVPERNEATSKPETKSKSAKPQGKKEGQQQQKETSAESNDTAENEHLSDSDESKSRKRKRNNIGKANSDEDSTVEDIKKDTVEESDEYSDVIDVVPTTKRKKGTKQSKDTSSGTKKAKPVSKPVSKPTNTTEDPQEAEIKKLQSQLTKCGIRKLWHNELKQYGEHANAKIKHLKKMLSDAGMDGRFSEAKAREIKETRELLAEGEAALEMNKLWGMNTSGRPGRNKTRKTTVESDASGDEGPKDADEDEEEEEVAFAARRRRAQADLAFLGDDSDSE